MRTFFGKRVRKKDAFLGSFWRTFFIVLQKIELKTRLEFTVTSHPGLVLFQNVEAFYSRCSSRVRLDPVLDQVYASEGK